MLLHEKRSYPQRDVGTLDLKLELSLRACCNPLSEKLRLGKHRFRAIHIILV